MANVKSRIQKNVRALSWRIEAVIAALNGDEEKWADDYDPAPLLLLVKRFQELELAWSQPKNRHEKQKGYFFPSDAVQKPWNEIASILHRYRAYPSLMLVGDAAGPHREWKLNWCRADKKPHLELSFALDLIEIFRAGKIGSLRQCRQCERWLGARFPHQVFCSDKCKELFHRFNEADKVRRREWAKENYQSRKELELGSRKAAQRKGGKR